MYQIDRDEGATIAIKFCLKSFPRDFKELLVFFQNTAISYYLYICKGNEKIQVDIDIE